ncbi:hypothetical protein NDU88_003297 [Pleurodeles waltl]|uniref:Uncharacterized protein n=1 Tax=Pleurodeles waltl TaxID=8319 RepID=A0AAV7KWM6_PLEWA|nr:hypothetical protein NDU88_003297 [Pleurodeles waltl]
MIQRNRGPPDPDARHISKSFVPPARGPGPISDTGPLRPARSVPQPAPGAYSVAPSWAAAAQLPVPQSHKAQGPPHGPNRRGLLPPTAGVGAGPVAPRSRLASPQASWAFRGSPPPGASDALPGLPISPHAGPQCCVEGLGGGARTKSWR